MMAATHAAAAPIVALGASNTEGRGRGRAADGVPPSQAYPAQLEALLTARGCRAAVMNAGVAGDTTEGMLARLPGVYGADTKVLILQPGGNDARRGASGRAENIVAIRDYVKKRGGTFIMLDGLGRIASGRRLADGQHFDAGGHAMFARYLLPRVLGTGVCR
ncbi:MAG: esterase [Hyphomicrobiales bacterium]|nr:esterase [Hyphomicrobiales bacterium]